MLCFTVSGQGPDSDEMPSPVLTHVHGVLALLSLLCPSCRSRSRSAGSPARAASKSP